jgi:folate-dependent phosphoribosylglycinamide formyltransferase PurN
MNTSDRASIVILTCHGPWHHALINGLARSHRVVGIVFEHQRALRYRLFARRLRKLGVLTVANQLLFKLYRGLALRKREECKARELFGDDASLREELMRRVTLLDTTSVNTPPVQDLIRKLKPDAVVVSGTSLLNESLLSSVGETPIINIHCGITPRYRGNHGAYWAVVNGDWENIGTTIHFIDAGVDTGEIISQAAIDVEPLDTPQFLAMKQYRVGIPLMVDAVSRIRQGTLSTMGRPDLDSRIHSSPTLTSYITYRKRLRERFPKGWTHTDSRTASN